MIGDYIDIDMIMVLLGFAALFWRVEYRSKRQLEILVKLEESIHHTEAQTHALEQISTVLQGVSNTLIKHDAAMQARFGHMSVKS